MEVVLRLMEDVVMFGSFVSFGSKKVEVVMGAGTVPVGAAVLVVEEVREGITECGSGRAV